MRYCSQCGGPVTEKVPEFDNRPRYVCDRCGTIHYLNPRIVVGCLPVWEERGQEYVLLCRRAIEPRKGFWTLPAGFMENGETTIEGALRETREEANALVEEESLYRLYDLPHISQVYMFYRARLKNTDFYAGAESLDVRLFTEKEIPWSELAFPVVDMTLKDFFSDAKTGEFSTRICNFTYPAK
jgi:ADP-ribose pyrophosphatase YjhB (NUDIX family)